MAALVAMLQLALLLTLTIFYTDGQGGSVHGGYGTERIGCCLSWRMAVEANNARGWATVPAQCVSHVGTYMLAGQYNRDLETVMDQIAVYLDSLVANADGLDAWVLDVDDTCLSNLPYYEGKQFGGMPFEPVAFRSWASRGICPAVPAIRQLFDKLIRRGNKVFLLTGRAEQTLGAATVLNLKNQGFQGYEKLFMRTAEFEGQSAVVFKSFVRKQLVREGYRIRGNVGDQWTDLQGECAGDRLFKIPNPMYFVP